MSTQHRDIIAESRRLEVELYSHEQAGVENDCI